MMLFKEDTPDPNLVAICKGNETYMFPGQKQLQMVLVSLRLIPGSPLAVWLNAVFNTVCNLLPWSRIPAISDSFSCVGFKPSTVRSRAYLALIVNIKNPKPVCKAT